MSSEVVTVLLVEDDDVDAEAIRRAFSRKKIANPVLRARDGQEALRILRGEPDAPHLSRPYLVLLDLNMPRMNGIELLSALREDERLRDSVVFVLTTSNSDVDKVAAYERNISGYLVKDRVGEGFVNLMELLGSFWRYVEFPPDLSLKLPASLELERSP